MPVCSVFRPRSAQQRLAAGSDTAPPRRQPWERTPCRYSHTNCAAFAGRFPRGVKHARRHERWRRAFPPQHFRIILDNHSAHISKETRAFLATHPNRFEYVLTPTHGSWQNIVETLFGKMARTLSAAYPGTIPRRVREINRQLQACLTQHSRLLNPLRNMKAWMIRFHSTLDFWKLTRRQAAISCLSRARTLRRQEIQRYGKKHCCYREAQPVAPE